MYGIDMISRLYITKSTPVRVMFGALEHYCMKFGVSDTSHLNKTQTERLVDINVTVRSVFQH